MLEINDFNAIRISLASPEDVLSWTHGEVTKPETINYRTLKPERDGLFCERIFGPTKDWECYCGKYKRVRYKGVVCDKCGVEVTRAKVRRDRMGHIALASPVSHIWFVKGTPSRLGLLIDITPRNLERVIYFAAYIIVHVDENQRKALREQVEQDYAQKLQMLQQQDESKRQELSEQREQVLREMESKQRSLRVRIENEYRSTLKKLDEEVLQFREELEEMLGQRVEEDLLFRGELLVEEDDVVTESVFDQLENIVDREKESLEVTHNRDLSNAEVNADDDRENAEREVAQKHEKFQEVQQREIETLLQEEKEKLEQIDNIRVRRVLSENEYRILREIAPTVFRADMGAGAIRDIVSQVDLDELSNQLQEEIQNTTGQRRKKATKRMRVIEKFRKSGNRPEWMILTVLPVIPPDLRPMVQLDGGRFATSDLNDLYRRVINRNNRLKRLMELSAPEIIVRNEKRMLQEAVDALIDNGRRGRAVSGKGKHRLKSLSDMLKGKQGRFRQNLLGKRVDYSGRSVIVVGPNLQLHQCGLPKKMALELFKPFVMRRLVEKGFAHNIKSAKRIVERVRPEVWDVLEEIIKDYMVLLNRAPSLHRLSIQGFEAKLIEGSAIQLHPLVCAAFNADFDGDQMAVHVPLSRKAQEEARTRMLSTYNLLSPAHGEPIITPSQDIVLGCYYLSMIREGLEDPADWRGKKFRNADEALLAYDKGIVKIQEVISVVMGQEDLVRFDYAEYSQYHDQINISTIEMMQQYFLEINQPAIQDDEKLSMIFASDGDLKAKLLPDDDGKRRVLVETTVGRLIFNNALLPPLRYRNELVAKKGLKEIIAECYKYYTDPDHIPPDYLETIRARFEEEYGEGVEAEEKTEQELARLFGSEMTSMQADMIKRLGFKYATLGGMTIGINDIEVPQSKYEMIEASEKQVTNIEKQFRRGLITNDERYRAVVDTWQRVNKEITEAVRQNLDPFGPVSMMAISGARGNINQITQMAGMRGLMSDPTGRIIELPIKANFREGLSVLEYFVSTHGGRKGLADTALRTADAGYLTRRLVDVAQDVIVTMEVCGTQEGVWLRQEDDSEVMEPLEKRLVGRVIMAPIVDSETGEMLVEPGYEIDEYMGRYLVHTLGLTAVNVRSPLTCQAEHGICRMCYGRNLATGKIVDVGEALGIIAAQSIGEPGTQLTLRTFHTGGVASADDITQGLPRVQEIFEARAPKGKSLLAEIDGIAHIMRDEEGVRRIRITSTEVYNDEYQVPEGYVVLAEDGMMVSEGDILAETNSTESTEPPILSRMSGKAMVQANRIVITQQDPDERELVVPHTSRMTIDDGDRVIAGQKLTEGSADPQELLAFQGKEAVQRYLVNEAQKVYRSQGVNINDKHIEVIVRQMLRRVRIEEPGDTGLLPNELIDISEFRRLNQEVVSQGGDPALAATVLLGITKASLSTDSFLSAASFQETTRVLTEASINGSVDYLRGLKENVVIGKLIPAGTGISKCATNGKIIGLPGEISSLLAAVQQQEEQKHHVTNGEAVDGHDGSQEQEGGKEQESGKEQEHPPHDEVHDNNGNDHEDEVARARKLLGMGSNGEEQGELSPGSSEEEREAFSQESQEQLTSAKMVQAIKSLLDDAQRDSQDEQNDLGDRDEDDLDSSL